MASSCNDLVAQYHYTEGACVHSSSPFARQPNFGTTEPDAATAARGSQSRGAGVLQGDRRRADRRHRRAHPDKEIRTDFQDEARFGQKGTITRVWAPKGSRPRAVRQIRYTSLYVLVAVCVSTGVASALIMPELNAGVLHVFLEQMSRELPAGVHAVLIWDGAGYHTSGDLAVPSNISLILLPPYSPELNPVENLWHYLRAHHWSNRPYQDYDELESEAAKSLCTVCLDRGKVESICNAEYVRKRA